jgi:hypothetical protein
VQATVIIDSPIDGTTFIDPEDRMQEISGRINVPPDILTLDGGHVDLWGNGQLIADAIGVGGDGTGEGSIFTSDGALQLAEGENTLQVIAYVSEVNRGFESGSNGEAGQAAVTVDYDPEDAAPTAPTLSALSYASTFTCPDGVVPVSFHFRDPDGDAVTAYESVVWVIDGEGGDFSGSVPIADAPELSCLTGTAADCEVGITYTGLHAGDWFEWEFWVEDATGLQSNHLEVLVTITGCPRQRLHGISGRIEGVISLRR